MNTISKNDDNYYMRKCIELAIIAKERGESPVGSIIVMDGKIVGEGVEGVKANRDITFHAEIEAVRSATKQLETSDLSECTLYTTHEPCLMCSYVIRHHKIKSIVFALTTGNIGGWSSKYSILTDTTIANWGAPPEIIVGVLEEQCRELKTPSVL